MKPKKLFRGMPLSQNGFGTCLIILGGCQNHSGNFLEFSEIKTENVSELPVPLWLFFANEIHLSEIVSERIQNHFSGYWNYSKTHRNIFGFSGREKLSS